MADHTQFLERPHTFRAALWDRNVNGSFPVKAFSERDQVSRRQAIRS